MLSNLYGLVSALVARMKHEEGQTMAEYAILVAVIALAVILVATLLGSSISSIFSSLAHNI